MGFLIALILLAFAWATIIGVKNGIEEHKKERLNPRAQHNLGCTYLQAGNTQLAIEHFLRASALGNNDSAFNLGVMYARGIGVMLDADEAFKWFQQAAEGGVANAQYNLAILFFARSHQDPESAPVESYKWLLRAAEQDHELARERVSSFEKAVDLGWDGDGQFSPDDLSHMRYGVGRYSLHDAARKVPGSGEHMELLERATSYGIGQAALILSEIYLRGTHVPRDSQKAFDWLKSAASLGCGKASEILELVPHQQTIVDGELEDAWALHERAYLKRGDQGAKLDVALRLLDRDNPDYKKVAWWLDFGEDASNPKWRAATRLIPMESWPPRTTAAWQKVQDDF